MITQNSEQNTDKTLSNKNHTNVFLGQFSKAIEIKTKLNKRHLIKRAKFCTRKETKTKQKITYRIGENVCKLYDWHGLISKKHTPNMPIQLKNNNKPNQNGLLLLLSGFSQ